MVFAKQRADAPADFFAWEAAGLGWLAEATPSGGADVVGVVEVGDHGIVLRRVAETTATAAAAESFGRALVRTHMSGAPQFGVGPPGWSGDGYIGRQALVLQPFSRWGEFYAAVRLLPFARAARQVGTLDERGLSLVEALAQRLIAGEFDDGRPPSRIHGDLWAGNVLYAKSGAVLIDPAAHGGHGVTDIAMLDLFGTPFLGRVKAAYAEAAELPGDWSELIGLHQLHPLLVHAVSHGPSYGRAARDVAAQYT